MEELTDETTRNVVAKSKFPFLIHKGWINQISAILKNKKIVKEKFVSFTDGLPLIPGHGDSAIIFDRQRLIDKGYKFLKIEYTQDFIIQHPEIHRHLFENKTDAEIRGMIENGFNNQIQRHKIQLTEKSKNEIENKISELSKMKHNALKEHSAYFLEMIKYEEEIVTSSPIEFDFGDVVKILISSRSFERYFPIPDEWSRKIEYVEDYFPPTFSPSSELGKWLKGRLTDRLIARSYGFVNFDLIMTCQVAFAIVLHPEWEIEGGVKMSFKALEILPKNIDRIFRKLDSLTNEEIEEIVDYTFQAYVLRYAQNSKLEEAIIRKLEKKLDFI